MNSGGKFVETAIRFVAQTHQWTPENVEVKRLASVQKMRNSNLIKRSGNVPLPLAVYAPNDGIWRDGVTLYIYLYHR
jgi:hypothetical protein